jgi:hypothetical protein
MLVGIAPDAIEYVAFSDKTACRSKCQHNLEELQTKVANAEIIFAFSRQKFRREKLCFK